MATKKSEAAGHAHSALEAELAKLKKEVAQLKKDLAAAKKSSGGADPRFDKLLEVLKSHSPKIAKALEA